MALRVRTYNQYAPARVYESKSGAGSAAIVRLTNYPKYYQFVFGQLEKSTITDVQPTKETRLTFNPCDHYREQAGLLVGDGFTCEYNPPLPSQTMRPLAVPVIVQDTLPTAPTPGWGDMIAELSGQLNGSINQGSLLAVTLLEAAKTIKMFRNPFNLMKPHWRKVAGDNPAAALLRKGSNVWLEHRYGWNALYNDMKNAKSSIEVMSSPEVVGDASALTQRFSVSRTETTSGSSSWVYPGSMTESSWNSWVSNPWAADSRGWQGRYKHGTCNHLFHLGCSQVLAAKEKLSRIGKIANLVGLDRAGVISSLWEVVPYSFVVDWFIDWHSLLPALTLRRLRGLDVRNLGYSIKSTRSTSIQLAPSWVISRFALPWGSSNRPTTLKHSRVCAAASKTSRYQRVLGSPPDSEIQSGFLTAGLSATQGISAGALIVQQLLKTR